MAQVVVNFDTASKEITVTMDGQPVENVMSISMSKKNGGYYSDDMGGDDYCCSITTLDKMDDDGYKKYTQIVANGTEVKKFPKVDQDIENFFADYRKRGKR